MFPPYIPEKNPVENMNSPITGIKLLLDAISRFKEYCHGELLILYSSLVKEEVAAIKKKYGLSSSMIMEKNDSL